MQKPPAEQTHRLENTLMRIFAPSVLLFAPCCIVCVAEEKDEGPNFAAAKPEKNDSELRRLQKERYNNAVELLRQELNHFNAGQAGRANRVGQAIERIVIAGLELEPGPRERLAMLEEALRMSKYIEKIVSVAQQVGQGTTLDVCHARAHRLEAEIRLQREKERGKR